MSKANLQNFDYQKVAKLDTDMWRAYYNHQFFKLFGQLFKLIHSQLGLNGFLTIRLAYHAGWAAADYRIRKKKGIKSERVLKNLVHFYKIISDHTTDAFDYTKAAKLELAWWEIHRRSYRNNKELEESLAAAAAVTYNVSPIVLKEYAHYRAEAMILPRHEGDDQKIPTNWDEVERLLIKAWSSLHAAVQK